MTNMNSNQSVQKVSRSERQIDLAQRLVEARAAIDEKGIQIRHLRKRHVFSIVGPIGVTADAILSITGGMTVAYTHQKGDSFIEVSTAICHSNDNYNRRTGTVYAVERFQEGATIRLPLTTLTPDEVIDLTFGQLMLEPI